MNVHVWQADGSPPPSGRLHVLLPTIGSAGDVLPVLALGKALQQRGHQATVVTNEIFEQLACDGGLDFIAMGSAEEGLAILDDPRLWHPTRGFECVVERAIVPNLGRLYEIILRERRPNTVVAASGMCLGARVAQETLGIPVATVHLQPALLRSLADAGMQGRIPMGPRVPRLVKRSLFWLMDKFFGDRLLMPPLNAFRAGLGLPPVDRILKSYIHSPQLVLGLFPDWFGALSPIGRRTRI